MNEGEIYPIVSDIEVFISDAKAGTLSPADAARAYAAIAAMRAQADRYERDLIRSLRWSPTGEVQRTWAEIAKIVNAQLSSKQAAHARWGRLKSPTRRTTTGDARRGGGRPGVPHQRT